MLVRGVLFRKLLWSLNSPHPQFYSPLILHFNLLTGSSSQSHTGGWNIVE